MRKIYYILIILILVACSPQSKEKKTIFVSILPQKYFVERIVGDDFDVRTLVLPGHSPATYEPLPRQMSKLSSAEIFFRIGVPFEKAWLNKIQASNPQLTIIDTRKGIELRNIEDAKELFDKHHTHNLHDHHHNGADPHIWLSPKLVIKQAQTIFETVSELYPDNKNKYEKNLELFIDDLKILQQEFQASFSQLKQTKFLVFHPVWGYLADEFDLQQIPIEISGKKPSAKELAAIIEYAKREKIRVLFVQQQFSTQEAESVAKVLGAKVIRIDPLAENYLENMRSILSIFQKQLT